MKNHLHFENYVKENWVDYNGHMNDSAYARIFSLAVEDFMDVVGLGLEARVESSRTIYTLENHICYLKEAYEGQRLHIIPQLLDKDLKRLHIFFTMKNDEGDILATSEQMLISVHMVERKPVPFPNDVLMKIEEVWDSYRYLEIPEQVGKKIGIKR